MHVHMNGHSHDHNHNHEHEFEERPWGRFDILSRIHVKDSEGLPSDVVIKKITVKPGARLSYQSHASRDEHWYVVSGEGLAIVEGKEINLKAGDSVDVKKEEKHRIGAAGILPLVFIEVSTGEVDEGDIIRYEDDFGRVK